jgi:Mg-chelatase subunit ChlD
MIRFHQLWVLALLVAPVIYLFRRRRDLRRSDSTDHWAIVLRAAAVALLLLALSGPQLQLHSQTHYIYFLVDRSDSTRATVETATLLERLRTWSVPQPNTQYGLIVFGKQAFVEAFFAPTLELEAFHTQLDPVGTDLAAALELALGTFPKGGTKTMVLLSDGQATQGDLSGVLVRAAREGAQVFTLPLDPPTSEYAVQDLRIPREVAVELPFVLQSVIYASKPTQARLFVYRNGAPVFQQEIALRAGLNFVEQSDELEQSGFYEYDVELIVPDDSLPANNRYRALVEAVGDPRILLVEAEPETSSPSPLQRLLGNAGHAYAKVPLRDFASSPVSLLPYRAVVLNDVPLRELSRMQMENVERYVRDVGGGLWLIQGRRAVEEFSDRAFERLLPVSYEGPEEVQRPALALIMLLDRSGSMGESVDTARRIDKMDLLKQAAIQAVEKLEARNLIGIIAFDTRHEWIISLGPARNRKTQIVQAIEALKPEGGTDIYQALREAIAQLSQVRARVKHILVFSDGKVVRENRDFEALFRELSQSTISASSIAIGSQADIEFMWRLANEGKGIRYEVKDARDLPEITLQELIRLERARWIRGPVPVSPGPFAFQLPHLDTRAIPPADGYVLTFEKPTAQTSLHVRLEEDLPADPFVSHWRYGLGKVLVLNTSITPEGLGRWLNWEGLSALTADVLSQIYSESPLQLKELRVTTHLDDSTLRVTAEAERDGLWLDRLSLEGQLSGRDGTPKAFEFEQIGPGQYQASVEDLTEGVYVLSVREESLGRVQDVISIPYASEYRRVRLHQEVLMEMAHQTGGEYLENLEELPMRLQSRTLSYHDIWQPITFAALLLFLADLIARKLPLPRQGS